LPSITQKAFRSQKAKQQAPRPAIDPGGKQGIKTDLSTGEDGVSDLLGVVCIELVLLRKPALRPSGRFILAADFVQFAKHGIALVG
jgi:hypothetical protein